MGALAMSETNSGSDVVSMKLRAKKEGRSCLDSGRFSRETRRKAAKCSSLALCGASLLRRLLHPERKQVLDHKRAGRRRPHCLREDRPRRLPERHHGLHCGKGKSGARRQVFGRDSLGPHGKVQYFFSFFLLLFFFTGDARFLNSSEARQTGHEGIQHS